MKSVYFDTNIYSHILKRQHGISERDVTKLFAKIRENRIRIYLSDAVLEETISAILGREKEAIARLGLIRRVANRKRTLKLYRAILTDNLTSYAAGQPVPSCFTSPGKLKSVLKPQNEISLTGLRLLADAIQGRIQEEQQRYDEMLNELRPQAKQEIKLRRRPTLEHYWGDYSVTMIEKFAQIAGVLPECQLRGIEGLFNLRPLKALIVAMLSQWYTNTYDKMKSNRGDSMDLQHVVYGAAVGTLVTHDMRFATHLKRLPIEGFEVTDLHSLLRNL